MSLTRLALGLGIALAACRPGLPRSQFGPYYPNNRHLLLPPADTLVVYRLKRWTFQDGAPPALQIEYEPRFAVSDTAAVLAEARRLWPVFAPYVEARHLTRAIVTATNFHQRGIWPLAWTSGSQSFGYVAVLNSDGTWQYDGDTVPLPPADTSGGPRIINLDGTRLPFTTEPVGP